MAKALSTTALTFVGAGRDEGHRARVENSFTRLRTVSAAPHIVSAQLRTTSRDAGSTLLPRSRCRRMRSAESVIGVSGFLFRGPHAAPLPATLPVFEREVNPTDLRTLPHSQFAFARVRGLLQSRLRSIAHAGWQIPSASW